MTTITVPLNWNITNAYIYAVYVYQDRIIYVMFRSGYYSRYTLNEVQQEFSLSSVTINVEANIGQTVLVRDGNKILKAYIESFEIRRRNEIWYHIIIFDSNHNIACTCLQENIISIS